MKLKILAASIALACSHLSAQNLQTAAWETTEYSRSRTLPAIKASSAYSRGYTGKGTVIAILDSGIDLTSPEFKDKILLSRNFSGTTTIQDTLGHGTHVAGIAAAARNGMGVQGVAPDAKLVIGKITASGLITSSTAINAVKWASEAGADVANLSSGFRITEQSISPTLIAPGVYKTSFTNTGKIAGGFDPNQWKIAIGKEMVLVVAAGNDGTAWSGALPQMASAVDSSGNLMLNGQMLVVGNWNSQGVSKTTIVNGRPVITTTYQTGPNNNGAAHLCMTMANNVCQDKFKLSDFYILAPGVGITSTVPLSVNKTGLLSMSGTSMAAPAVSGGAALIRQMWPQMTGSNIVKLLLVTADKTIQGYNVSLHGQGLLDLDKATRPVGNLGIPTTGRLAGPTVPGADPLLLTGGSASIGNKTSIMVVDSFERDFYVKGKAFTGYLKQQYFKPAQAAMPYITRNNYTQFNNYTDRFNASSNGYDVSLYQDSASAMLQLDFPVYTNMKLSTGVFTEQNTWLGNMTNSFAGGGNNTPSTTYFSGLNFNRELDYGINAFGSIMHGITWTSANSTNIKNIGPALSYTWNFGAEYKMAKSSIGAMVYQPVTVYRANADLNAPVGLDNEFNVVQHSRVNLAADVKETRAGLFYKMNNFVAFIEHRQNFQGQENVSTNAVGFNYSAKY